MSILEFRAEELPSRGITYPEGTVFSLQTFTYGEVQNLNNSNLSLETKVSNFIKNCTINTDMEGGNIAYVDYIYMHLGRVASVYNNDSLRLPITCPFCGGDNTEKIAFSQLEMNDIAEYADIIPFTFDIKGHEYSFNFLTLDKMIEWFRLVNTIQEYNTFVIIEEEHSALKEEVDKLTPENPNPVLLNRWENLHRQFIELNGKMTNKTKDKAIKYKDYGYNALLLAFMSNSFNTPEFDIFLRDLTSSTLEGQTIEYLDFVESVLGTGLKPLKSTCDHCSKVYAYSVEENVNDIYPFRDSSTSIADRLRALQKAKQATIRAEEGGLQQPTNSVREHSERQGFSNQQEGYIGGDDNSYGESNKSYSSETQIDTLPETDVIHKKKKKLSYSDRES